MSGHKSHSSNTKEAQEQLSVSTTDAGDLHDGQDLPTGINTKNYINVRHLSRGTRNSPGENDVQQTRTVYFELSSVKKSH
jgi:hypothetical protein